MFYRDCFPSSNASLHLKKKYTKPLRPETNTYLKTNLHPVGVVHKAAEIYKVYTVSQTTISNWMWWQMRLKSCLTLYIRVEVELATAETAQDTDGTHIVLTCMLKSNHNSGKK